MQNIKEQLQYLILNNLMSLPAYKLNKQYKAILKEYTYSRLSKLIKKNNFKDNWELNNNKDNSHKSIGHIYQRPSKLEIFLIAVKSFQGKYTKLGLVVVASFILALLTRVDNRILGTIGILSLLVFLLSSLEYCTNFNICWMSAENTFSFINRQIDNIDEYINHTENIKNINEKNLDMISNMIVKDIINDEISGLNYDLWKKDIFSFVFAIIISLLYVYLLGNTFVAPIQWIANVLNFSDFEFIKKINLELLIFTIIFPLGFKSGNYIYISSLKDRNKRLRQSLRIVENRIQERENTEVGV